MKSQKMLVILLATVFTVALSAPMTTKQSQIVSTITTRKPETPLADLVLEVQERGILRDYYKSWATGIRERYENGYSTKNQELMARKKSDSEKWLSRNPTTKFDESPYSTDPFFKEKQNDEEPKIEKYQAKLKYYNEMRPFQYNGDYAKAINDGLEFGTNKYDAMEIQLFYNGLWKKRNLPYEKDDYKILRDYWEKQLNERQALVKKRGPSQAELFAYHKYLSGPEPPGGYTNPPWITTSTQSEKKYPPDACSWKPGYPGSGYHYPSGLGYPVFGCNFGK